VAGGTAGACARLRLAAGVPVPEGCADGERDGLADLAELVGLAEADAVAAAEAELRVRVGVGVGVGAADDRAGVGAVWVLPAPYM
jgi:hypothetical protein